MRTVAQEIMLFSCQMFSMVMIYITCPGDKLYLYSLLIRVFIDNCVWLFNAVWVNFCYCVFCSLIAQNNKGWTALHYAARKGYASLARDLITMYKLDPNTANKVCW